MVYKRLPIRMDPPTVQSKLASFRSILVHDRDRIQPILQPEAAIVTEQLQKRTDLPHAIERAQLLRANGISQRGRGANILIGMAVGLGIGLVYEAGVWTAASWAAKPSLWIHLPVLLALGVGAGIGKQRYEAAVANFIQAIEQTGGRIRTEIQQMRGPSGR